ncbi:hypothetical protein Pmani_016164 [Petrolisthes manimaculis]|uniref:Uncharacterized protein n=1 Tax=Petrolisthes manimaculis TaxID=1843537 RepID=A0AAE1PQ19_9EUCA|nr:hypothetical protein Pmani_016164 [Petrolisthes manimaculis]
MKGECRHELRQTARVALVTGITTLVAPGTGWALYPTFSSLTHSLTNQGHCATPPPHLFPHTLDCNMPATPSYLSCTTPYPIHCTVTPLTRTLPYPIETHPPIHTRSCQTASHLEADAPSTHCEFSPSYAK